LVPALESLLLVALVLATPGDEVPGSRMRQRLAVALVGVLAIAPLVGLGQLAHLVVEEGAAGHGFVDAAIVLWGTIVLVFALGYWELDRGGPVARAQPELTGPFDFLFTQSTDEGRAVAPGWRPSFNTDARTRTGDPFITSEIQPFGGVCRRVAGSALLAARTSPYGHLAVSPERVRADGHLGE
jgi:hypothetical protein